MMFRLIVGLCADIYAAVSFYGHADIHYHEQAACRQQPFTVIRTRFSAPEYDAAGQSMKYAPESEG